MVEIFVSTTGSASANPVTKQVRLNFENNDLDEITIQLPFVNLQMLMQQAKDGIGFSESVTNDPDVLLLGATYRVVAQTVSRTPNGARLTTHFETDGGLRVVGVDLTPLEASQLADDLYEAVGRLST